MEGRPTSRTDIPHWCLYPIGYIFYTLVRGEVIGRYPYPFIDVGELGYGRVLINAAGLLLGFVSIAAILVGAGALKKDPFSERSS